MHIHVSTSSKPLQLFVLGIFLTTVFVVAQVPQPVSPPPDGDCPFKICLEEDDDNLPLGHEPQVNPSLLAGIPTLSPMPFLAVGDGAGDGSSDVYTFQYYNGAITNFYKIGEAGRILWDIAIDPSGSPWASLYGISDNGRLYRVSQSTGATTYVGNTGFSLNALDFCTYGNLYAWGTGRLVTLNTSTGQGTAMGPISGPPYDSSGDLMCGNWQNPGSPLIGIALGSNDYLIGFEPTYGFSFVLGGTLPGNRFYGGEIDGHGNIFVAKVSGGYLRLYYVDSTTYVATLVATKWTSYGLNGLTTYPAAL